MWPAGDSKPRQEGAAMNPDSPMPLMLVLAGRSAGGRLAVELQSFLRFSAEMDLKLEDLERRWAAFRRPVCHDARTSRRRGAETR